MNLYNLKELYFNLRDLSNDLEFEHIPFQRELIRNFKKKLKQTTDWNHISYLKEQLFVNTVDLNHYLSEKKALNKEMDKLWKKIEKQQKKE